MTDRGGIPAITRSGMAESAIPNPTTLWMAVAKARIAQDMSINWITSDKVFGSSLLELGYVPLLRVYC